MHKTYPKRSRRKARSHEGAVLVEGILVSACLIALFASILVVRLYVSLQIAKLDEARDEAWEKSMQGCDSDSSDLREMALAILNLEFLFPGGFVPSSLYFDRSFSANGIFSASGHREIKFICDPQPAEHNPLTDATGWAWELVTG